MTFGAQPITIVEIDVDYCPLYFGRLEPTSTPDLYKYDGSTIANAELNVSGAYCIVADVEFDGTAPDGILWEQGGSGAGVYLGVTSGELVFRAGAGGTLPQDTCAMVRVDVTPMIGLACHIIAEILPDDDAVRLRVIGDDKVKYLDETGVAPSGMLVPWAGAGSGGAIGTVAGNYPLGESGTDWNGAITDVLFWEGVFPDVGCPASLGGSVERKCFNGYHTCPVKTVFEKSSLTLRFCHNQSGIPKIAGIYPVLQSVSTNPEEINLSGASPRSTALGKRARITADFLDFVDDDNYTDKYQAERVSGAAQSSGVGYDTARGTFFAKLIARNPYYLGRPLRIRRGYVGQALSAMTVENYVISEFDGPSASGAVQIVAKDVFDLVDGEKVLAPAPSRGKLSDAITETSDTATLTPSGIGDSDYPASGLVRIGTELIRYTRSGDVLTLTARGAEGTTAESHDELDVVQSCLEYVREQLVDIANDLLTVQGPIDAAFFDVDTARAEEASWLGGTVFSGIVSEPTPIPTLVGELLQHGAMLWWSSRDQEIKFRANRPLEPDETAETLTDGLDILETSREIIREKEARISTVYFWHGVIDPTEKMDDARNFSKVAISVDPSSASANEYDQSRIKNIYSRWFGSVGNDAFASVIAERLVSRYRDVPVIFSGVLDVKDSDIAPGDIADITSAILQDTTGLSESTRFQITKVERGKERVKIRAESFAISGRFGFWMTNPQADYDTATDEEIAIGAFWFDENETDFGDGTGPYLYF